MLRQFLAIMCILSIKGVLLTGIFHFRAEPTYQGLEYAMCHQHSISWPFYVYSKPDITTEPIELLTPRTVDIVRGYLDGWALIDTGFGRYWTNIIDNKIFINRTMGLFRDKDDIDFVDIIGRRVTTVIDRDGDWIKINTHLGPMWIDPYNFVPPTDELYDLVSRHGMDISIHYENFETGFIFQYNANQEYKSASVPKAMQSLYLYLLAEDNLVDLDGLHTFLYEDGTGGSGYIWHNYLPGAEFTLRELARLNISVSDNVTAVMINRILYGDRYREFIARIGGNPNFVAGRIMESILTANEAGLFAREIFRYIESDGRYSEEFKSHLLNNQYPFIVADYPVASKTGWHSPVAWHDMAIIYAPSPFSLVILSHRAGWGVQDYADFAEISMAFQEFNEKWFGD